MFGLYKRSMCVDGDEQADNCPSQHLMKNLHFSASLAGPAFEFWLLMTGRNEHTHTVLNGD